MLLSNLRNQSRSVVFSVLFAVALTGCGKGSNKNPKIDGIDGPNVNFVDNKFTMSLVVKNLQFDFGTRIVLPNMPSSYLEIGPDFQSNGLLLSVGLDVNDIKKLSNDGFALLDPQTLPGGRPLPGVLEGHLPGFAVQVPNWHDVAFYIGANVFGIFVPHKMPWKDYMGTFRFYDGAGDPIGTISLVGQDSKNENGGVLLLVQMKGKISSLMAKGRL